MILKKDIHILENMYNENTYRALFEKLHQHPFRYFWFDTPGGFYWNSSLEEDTPVKELCNTLLDEFTSKFDRIGDLTTSYVNAQTYGLEPGAHYDSPTTDTVTVINYITDVWNIGWGGETFIYDKYAHTVKDTEVESVQKISFEPIPVDAVVAPSYNKTLIIPGNQLHCVRPLSKNFPGSRFTYMYKLKGITVKELMEGYHGN
jgi:hypothetical protein